jgi:hypothetical protein
MSQSVGQSRPGIRVGWFGFVTIMGLLMVMPVSVASAQISKADWEQEIPQAPPNDVGCYSVAYPSTTWTPETCVSAGSAQLTVGAGTDYVGNSSTPIIGQAIGYVLDMSGFNGERDSVLGTNYYTLQLNSQFFSTTYAGHATDGWQQFVFESAGTTGDGKVFMQYWLIGYHATYGSCPATSPLHVSAWKASGSDCMADSNATNTNAEPAANLANPLKIEGYVGQGSGGTNDIAEMCDFSVPECWTTTITSVLGLDGNWKYTEFNVFGAGGGSEAEFTTPLPSLELEIHQWTVGGTAITPTCFSDGFSQETNNLDLGTCTVSGAAYYVTES